MRMNEVENSVLFYTYDRKISKFVDKLYLLLYDNNITLSAKRNLYKPLR